MTDISGPLARATITGFVEAVRPDGITVGGIPIRAQLPQGLQVHDAVSVQAQFFVATGWDADALKALANPLSVPGGFPAPAPAPPAVQRAAHGGPLPAAPGAGTPRSQRFGGRAGAGAAGSGGKANASDRQASPNEPPRPPVSHKDSQVKF